jgi:5-formyltetrahydrofolate cyclo-ligase
MALPVINDTTQKLDFCIWSADMEMKSGIWNIPVPVQQSVVHPTTFLVPLVGFDSANYRLGYGGGYYDRTLACITGGVTTIGVGLEMGRFDTIHPHEHDIAMDIVVTETVIQRR